MALEPPAHELQTLGVWGRGAGPWPWSGEGCAAGRDLLQGGFWNRGLLCCWAFSTDGPTGGRDLEQEAIEGLC